MKGIHGLIVAIILGAAGAIANFYYLNTEAQKKDVVAFIGIKKGAIIGRGERLTEDNLVKVEIPANHVGNLKDYACRWEGLAGVKDMRVWHALDSNSEGAMLLLQSDLKTPPKELELHAGELAVGVQIPRSFVTSLVNPGAQVSFRFSTIAPKAPTLAPLPRPATTSGTPATSGSGSLATSGSSANSDLQPKPETSDLMAAPADSHDTIGPFVVLSVGNRLGTVEVMKAAKISPAQENVLLLRVSKKEPREEENFEKVLDYIHRYGVNSYEILLHGKQ